SGNKTVDPNADVVITGDGSINISGSGIGTGGNNFGPGDGINFSFAEPTDFFSIGAGRGSDIDGGINVTWEARNDGIIVAQGSYEFFAGSVLELQDIGDFDEVIITGGEMDVSNFLFSGFSFSATTIVEGL